jgi:hypothetical protein
MTDDPPPAYIPAPPAIRSHELAGYLLAKADTPVIGDDEYGEAGLVAISFEIGKVRFCLGETAETQHIPGPGKWKYWVSVTSGAACKTWIEDKKWRVSPDDT